MLLVGIVAVRVEVLKLGAGMGRSMTLTAELQSRNELLRAGVARLSDTERIEQTAMRLGMHMPGPTEIRFLSAGRTSLRRAIDGIGRPNPTDFSANLVAEEQADGDGPTSTGAAGGTSPSSAGDGTTTLAQPGTTGTPGGSSAGGEPAGTTGATTSAGGTSAAGTTGDGTTAGTTGGGTAPPSGATGGATPPATGATGTGSTSGGAGLG